MEKPSFKKKEVIVRKVEDNLNLGGNTKETVSEVIYVGSKAENYKSGDKVLFDSTIAREIKHFGEPLWRIENEDYIICQIVEDSGE